MDIIGPPDTSEFAEYYTKYIDQVPAGDIRQVLNAQLADLASLYLSISDEQSTHRYAPDKWTIRQVVSHINDTERVFSFRALLVRSRLRRADAELRSGCGGQGAGADERTWQSHVDEFRAVRDDHARALQWAAGGRLGPPRRRQRQPRHRPRARLHRRRPRGTSRADTAGTILTRLGNGAGPKTA